MKTAFLSALLILVSFFASAQVNGHAVATYCAIHKIYFTGAVCPKCAAAQASQTSGGATPNLTPAPGLSPAAQAAGQVLQQGITSFFDALNQQSSAPTPADLERNRQLMLQNEKARLEEQKRQEQLLSSLKLSTGSTTTALTAPPDNPLGLKLGPSAQEASLPGEADGLAPKGTSFFGLGGGDGSNVLSSAQSDRNPVQQPGTDTSSGAQLRAAAGGQAGNVLDGGGATKQGGLLKLDLKGIPREVRENQNFQALNQMRNQSIDNINRLQSQLATLNAQQAQNSSEDPVLKVKISGLEDQIKQSEAVANFTNKEMKRQFSINMNEE